DDVRIISATLWAEDESQGAAELLKVAHAIEAEIKRVPGTRDIYTIGGFSAHADQAELLAWHGNTGNPSKTYLIHGEENSMQSFSRLLTQTDVFMPELGDSFNL
ncbi:MAG TPA: MBL fold metallo-hydrolase, partial [Chromatiaceae bacterium]|nr:MBL fold metallo-hydrolase [Chromatiaceae bacterium]